MTSAITSALAWTLKTVDMELPIRMVDVSRNRGTSRTHMQWMPKEKRLGESRFVVLKTPRLVRRINREDCVCRCRSKGFGFSCYCAVHAPRTEDEGWLSKLRQERIVSRYKRGMYDHIGYDHVVGEGKCWRYYKWANYRMNSIAMLNRTPRDWVVARSYDRQRLFTSMLNRSYDLEIASASVYGYRSDDATTTDYVATTTDEEDDDDGTSGEWCRVSVELSADEEAEVEACVSIAMNWDDEDTMDYTPPAKIARLE